MSQRKLVIVGLRNFDSSYTGTKHNIAEAALQYVARQHGVSFSKNGGADLANLSSNIVLALPRTFMNISGKPVKALMDKPLDVANVLVVHDALDVALGKVKIKNGGSANGHNGVKSIIASLAGKDGFKRVLVGIDRPVSRNPEVIQKYVLGSFTRPQAALLPEVFQQVDDLIQDFVKKWLLEGK
jgi:PTH1 family peptidyl-tRNA hydrolase